MAVYIGHVLSTNGPKLFINSIKSVIVSQCRGTSAHKKVKKFPKRYIQNVPVQSKLNSLSSRGFMRNLIPYKPPVNAAEILKKYFIEIVGTDDLSYRLDNEKQFQLLSTLNKELSYAVPNSVLHKMNTLDDVFQFYLSPVDCTVPYDRFKSMKLPPNLHIIQDYKRFHPDSDTMFEGVTAFPKSSTIISGLKAKKKYKGFDAGSPWDDI